MGCWLKLRILSKPSRRFGSFRKVTRPAAFPESLRQCTRSSPASAFPPPASPPTSGPNPSSQTKSLQMELLYLSSRRDALQVSISSIRCEGTRSGRPRKTSSSSRPKKENNALDPRESDSEAPKSSSQEEIIALFKRIQSSISNEPRASKKKTSNRTKERKSTESVLEDLQQHPLRKQVKDKISIPENVLPVKKVDLEKEERNSSAMEDRLPRPVSNFVKRSPIRSMAPTKEKTGEVPEVETRDMVREEVPAKASERLESLEIDKLKLPELKELAKLKGVKGFSKLKKRELVELLKGMVQPS